MRSRIERIWMWIIFLAAATLFALLVHRLANCVGDGAPGTGWPSSFDITYAPPFGHAFAPTPVQSWVFTLTVFLLCVSAVTAYWYRWARYVAVVLSALHIVSGVFILLQPSWGVAMWIEMFTRPYPASKMGFLACMLVGLPTLLLVSVLAVASHADQSRQ